MWTAEPWVRLDQVECGEGNWVKGLGDGWVGGWRRSKLKGLGLKYVDVDVLNVEYGRGWSSWGHSLPWGRGGSVQGWGSDVKIGRGALTYRELGWNTEQALWTDNVTCTISQIEMSVVNANHSIDRPMARFLMSVKCHININELATNLLGKLSHARRPNTNEQVHIIM